MERRSNISVPFLRVGRRGISPRPASGQVLVEWAIVAAILVASVAILSVFLYTFKESGSRVLDLVASEYP